MSNKFTLLILSTMILFLTGFGYYNNEKNRKLLEENSLLEKKVQIYKHSINHAYQFDFNKLTKSTKEFEIIVF